MATKYTITHIPNGESGTRATLKAMGEIVNQYKKVRAVRELALRIIQDVPAKRWRLEVQAIFDFVKSNIRYTKDVRGVETLHSPIQLLRLKQGDCDDMSILAASLLESIGHPTRFCAVGINGSNFCHVFAQTKIGGKWVTLECTKEDYSLGQTPRKITKIMVHNN